MWVQTLDGGAEEEFTPLNKVDTGTLIVWVLQQQAANHYHSVLNLTQLYFPLLLPYLIWYYLASKVWPLTPITWEMYNVKYVEQNTNIYFINDELLI